jgi:PAP2 superfamily C-terminal
VTQSSVPDQPRASLETRRSRLLRTWQIALRDVRLKWLILLSVAFSLTSVQVLLHALRLAEERPGVVLNDPILALLPVADLSVPIFVIEYGCALAVLYQLLSHPVRLAVGLFGYGTVMFCRWITITLVPLDPPPDLVLLIDPVVEALGGGPIFTKDLFFSGHTAAMMMFTLSAPKRKARLVFACLTAVIGVMLMIQRVHYSIDVFVALFMAYAGWRFARTTVPLAFPSLRRRVFR